MVTSCDDAMASPSTGGSAASILTQLTDKSTTAETRVNLYSTLAQEFQKEDISDVLHVVSQQNSSLSGLFCADIQCDQKELNQAALRILGLCLHYEEIAKSFSEGDSVSVLSALCSTILKTEDKNTCTRALWCLSRQQLPDKTIQSELHSILCAFEHVLQQNKFQSMTAEFEAINLLIRLLDQIPDNMASHTTRWAPLLFPLMVHSAHKIRAKANQATQLALPALRKHQADLAPSLVAALKSTIVVDMAELFANKQEQFVLRVWRLLVELLGKTLHKGGSLINLLLRVVEQGFKHGYPEVKRDSFEAWKVLIDNFSLDLDVLSNAKRLKLLLQPFLATSTKQESVALAKFDAWWHLCKALGPRLSSNFEMVVVPLLHFCLGLNSSVSPGAASATTPSSNSRRKLMNSVGYRALAMTSPATTPRMDLSSPCRVADSYRSILSRGVIVMTYMLTNQDVHVNSEPIKQQINDPPEALSMPVLSKGALVFIKITSNLIPIVVNSIQQHRNVMGEDLCVVMFGTLTQHVRTALENSKKQDNAEMFGVFLYNLNTLVKNTDIEPSLLLKFTASLKCLPTKVLSSTAYVSSHVGCVLNGTPTLFLLELLFGPKLIKSSTDERFFILLERLVECGISTQSSVLGFSTVYISLANSAATSLDNKEILWRVWSVLATPLLDHILQTNEVNQGDSFEHDFSAMIGCLLFPIQQILPFDVPAPTKKALLKTWTELYQAFARCAALVTTAGDNQSCQDLCVKIVAFVQAKDFQMTLPFIEAALMVCRVMLDSLDFSSYSDQATDALQSPVSAGKWSKKHHWPLKNLTALVKLVAHLMNAFHRHRIQYEKPIGALMDSWFSIVNNSCHILTVLFGHIGRTSLLQQLIGRLAKPISGFYGKDNRFPTSAIYKTSILPKLDKLWQDVLTGIQARYHGPYDAESLAVFEPLLEATLSSPHRSIRNHTLLFWNATFAKASSLKYSERMKVCLQSIKKTSSVTLPDWSDVDVEEEETDLGTDDNTIQSLLVPTTLSPSPRKVHGSFLQRPTEARQLFVSSSPFKSPGKSPMQTAKRAPSPAREKAATRRKLNIEEESTQDFVFIAPSPKKRQSLTEHQKEVMRGEHVIPALYNDLEPSLDNQVFSELSQSQLPEKSLEDVPSSDVATGANILTDAFAALKRAEMNPSETEYNGDGAGNEVRPSKKNNKHVKFVDSEVKQDPPVKKGTDDFVAKMNEKIRALKNSTKGITKDPLGRDTPRKERTAKGANDQPSSECSVKVIEETQSQTAISVQDKTATSALLDVKEQLNANRKFPGQADDLSENLKIIPETQGNQTSQTVVSPSIVNTKASPKTPLKDPQSFPFEVTEGVDLTDLTIVGHETTPRIKISTPRVKVQKLDLTVLELSQSKRREQSEKAEQTTPIITPSPTGSQTPNETPRFRRHKSEEVGSRSIGSGRRRWHSFGDAKTDSPKEKLSPKEIFSPLELEEHDFSSFCKSSSASADKMDIDGIQPLDYDAEGDELNVSDPKPEDEERTVGDQEETPSLRRGRRQRKAKTFADFVTPQKLLSSIHLSQEDEEATGVNGPEGGCSKTDDDGEKQRRTVDEGAAVVGHQIESTVRESRKEVSATPSTVSQREGTGDGRSKGKIRRIIPVQVLEEEGDTPKWEPTQELFSEEVEMGDEAETRDLQEILKVDNSKREEGVTWTNVMEKEESQNVEEVEAELDNEEPERRINKEMSVEPRSAVTRTKRLGRGRRGKRSEDTEVIDLCDTQSQELAKDEVSRGDSTSDKVMGGNKEVEDEAAKDETAGSHQKSENVKEETEGKKRVSSRRKRNGSDKDMENKQMKGETGNQKSDDREPSDVSDDDIPLKELVKPQDPSRDEVGGSHLQADVVKVPKDSVSPAKRGMVSDLASDSPLSGKVDPEYPSRGESASRVESPKKRSISPKIRRNLSEKFQKAKRNSVLSTPLSARKRTSPHHSPRLLRSAGAIHTRLRSKGSTRGKTKVSPKMRNLLKKRKVWKEEASAGKESKEVDRVFKEEEEESSCHEDLNEGEAIDALKLDMKENMKLASTGQGATTLVEDVVLTQCGENILPPENHDLDHEHSSDTGAAAERTARLLSQEPGDDAEMPTEEMVNSSYTPTKLNPVDGTRSDSARHCGMLENLKGGDSVVRSVEPSGSHSPVIPVQAPPGIHSSPVLICKKVPCKGSPEVMGIPGVLTPTASPSNGILKKREEAGCNSPSPNNKNRRVKFSEKVSTKEIEHRTPNRSPGSTRCRAMSKMSPSPLVTTSSRVVSVMSKYITTPKGSSEKLTKTTSSRHHSSRKARSPSHRNKAARFHQPLQTPPTQGSPSSQLESSLEDPEESVYPELSDCQTPVEVILPQLTSSMWSRGLGQLMRARSVFTVGQLSTLTPSEVQSLPIRCPKVTHLRWVLGKHHQKLQAKNATEERGKATGVDNQAPSPEKAVKENSAAETPSSLKRKRDTQDLPESPEAKKLRLVEQLEKLSEGCNDEVLRSVSPEQLFKAYGHINSMMDTIMGVLKTKYTPAEKPS